MTFPAAGLDLPALLAALEHHVAHARVAGFETRSSEVVVDGWGRPHTTLLLYGPRGEVGRGEYIGWTGEDHQRFADDPKNDEAYSRCAWEAALIDLGLRQAGMSLAALTGAPAVVPLRYAISFDSSPDAARRARAILATNPGARFKVDYHDDAVYDDVPLAVLDYKGKGGQRRALPDDVIVEDPPDDARRAPWARDQPILSAAAVQPLGTHLNLKAPRMGGFLEALRGAIRARELGLQLYWGGMFEVGIARRQARQLAALVCPDADNDLAPIVAVETASRGPNPIPVHLDRTGFG